MCVCLNSQQPKNRATQCQESCQPSDHHPSKCNALIIKYMGHPYYDPSRSPSITTSNLGRFPHVFGLHAKYAIDNRRQNPKNNMTSNPAASHRTADMGPFHKKYYILIPRPALGRNKTHPRHSPRLHEKNREFSTSRGMCCGRGWELSGPRCRCVACG